MLVCDQTASGDPGKLTADTCTVVAANSHEELVELSVDADVLVTGFGAIAAKAAWQQARQLKLIHSLNVGVDNIEALDQVPVPVANVSRAHSISVAEHAVALLLAWCKNIFASDVAFKTDHWLGPDQTAQFYGKTCGIIGLGNIGMEIAQRMSAFGLQVIGVKRSINDQKSIPRFVDQVYAIGSLHEVLAHSDYIFVACPFTPDTEGLVGPAEFAAMKASAVLVNIARAEIVQEEALFSALTNNQIAGACLDVWYFKAPRGAMFQGAHPPSRKPINRLSNGIPSPHLGYKTECAFDCVWAFVADNIDRLARGEPLTNQVNKRAGY